MAQVISLYLPLWPIDRLRRQAPETRREDKGNANPAKDHLPLCRWACLDWRSLNLRKQAFVP